VLCLQIAVVYGLIEAALWTPVGPVNTLCIALATVCILLFAFGGRFSAQQMGIAPPPAAGSGWIVLGGAFLAAMIPLCALLGRGSGPSHVLPFRQAGQYAIWALAQQFVLQSFFYIRIESVLGGKPAVLVTAVLFGAAHIPSPILCLASFIGALFFCETFRRFRNIFPLGVVHAGLGLVLAATFSDSVLHHMRVGMGYVRFHP